MDVSTCDESLLKILYVQFLTIITRCVNFGKPFEPISFDLPDAVVLLQSCGYGIRRIDCINPEDLPPLRYDNSRGSRVVITCLHSGQRCFLEKVQSKESCTCAMNGEANKNEFWEVTATTGTTSTSGKNESIIETGSDYIPSITKEQKVLINNVLSTLITMVKDADQTTASRSSSTSSLASRGATSSPDRNHRRLSCFLKDIGANIISPSNTNLGAKCKGLDSPARYRSLDTLTSAVDANIPIPGKLTPKGSKMLQHKEEGGNIPSISRSSPNIKLASEEPNSSGSTIGDSHTEKVIRLLKKAITLLDQNKSQDISPSNFMNPLDLMRRKLSSKKKNVSSGKSNSTSKLPNDNIRRNTVTLSKEEPKKVIRNATKTIPTTKSTVSIVKKPINLYAHVKSTIPKAASSKLPDVKKK